jgi:polyhydroxybutyrate depolymerase
MTSGVHEIGVGGVVHTFEVVAPTGLSQPGRRRAPVIVLFHGFASTAANIIATSGLGEMAAANGVVLVAPQAVGEPTGWHIDQPEFNDGEFTDAVLAQIRASQCVDPDMIWLAGFSAGSAWTGVYGCNHTDEIAGLLMHSGLAPPICPADSTPNIYIVHGVADPFVPFAGGSQTVGTGTVLLQPVPESAAGWATTAGCDETPSVRSVGDQDTITTWSGCRGGRTVMFQAVAGLGHAWSGGSESSATLNPGCVLVQMLAGAGDAVAECATPGAAGSESVTESS